MTTGGRPTWAAAKGGNEQGGARIFGPSQKYSSRDIAAHATLKPRREGQDTQEELEKRYLKSELEERERKHFSSKDKGYGKYRDRIEFEKRIVPRNTDEDSDEDDEDDKEALMAQLGQLRKEKAERKEREEELKVKEAELSFGTAKRWDGDVVFKNQTLGEAKSRKCFINDTIRSDFHRKFLQKCIK